MALASEYPEEMRDYIPVVVNLLNEMKGTKTRSNGPKGTLAGKIERAKGETAKLFPDYVTVACQGTEGANSQIACDRIFRNSDIMFFSNFDAVFTSIEKGLQAFYLAGNRYCAVRLESIISIDCSKRSVHIPAEGLVDTDFKHRTDTPFAAVSVRLLGVRIQDFNGVHLGIIVAIRIIG